MRLGAFGLTAPADIDAEKALEWSIEQAANLNVQVLGGDHRPTFRWGMFPCDRGYWRELKAMAAAKGLEIEPYVRSPFDLASPSSGEARVAMVDSIRASKELGGPVMRTAYGDQTVARTRFASIPLREHLKLLESNLHEAAKIAESEDVVLAIENHTDFSGREWAAVFSKVDSERIRCAFDTGNGMTIFSDPAEDAEALARWSVTTHVKDMRVIENPRPSRGMSPQVPFGITGCPIGEGSIDLAATLRRLLRESLPGDGLPLIVEPSWPPGATEANLADKRNALIEANLRNLRRLLKEL